MHKKDRVAELLRTGGRKETPLEGGAKIARDEYLAGRIRVYR
jgi:hypothetical protein